MPNTYYVHNGVQVDSEIHFNLDNNPGIVHITVGERMITDSDTLSFVYLLEDEQGYHYVKFGQHTWHLLVNALKLPEDPILHFGEIDLTLHMLREELEMLIFNIEGNDNYGEEFVKAVEDVFDEILKA